MLALWHARRLLPARGKRSSGDAHAGVPERSQVVLSSDPTGAGADDRCRARAGVGSLFMRPCLPRVAGRVTRWFEMPVNGFGELSLVVLWITLAATAEVAAFVAFRQ
jgi:hypothetical protein